MHERRVLNDIDVDERDYLRRFALTMDIIDTTYNTLLSERLWKDGSIQGKSSYHVFRNLTRVAESGWASTGRHWEELFGSNPDKPQCCEPCYVSEDRKSQGKVNYPFDILGIFFVVNNIALDHPIFKNLLKLSLIHDDGFGSSRASDSYTESGWSTKGANPPVKNTSLRPTW